MEKFTREYAEKLAQNNPQFRYSYEEDCFADGWMSCLEETNAPELLEALKIGLEMVDKLQFPTESQLKEFKIIALNAINKATL